MTGETRILIFEPIPTDGEFMELQIRKAGLSFSAKRVGTRDMFDKLLSSFAPDLIVADHAVPRCDVLALVRKTREQDPALRWIIVSGSATDELAAEYLAAGAAGFLAKKNIARLGTVVKGVLEAPVDIPPADSMEETLEPQPAGTVPPVAPAGEDSPEELPPPVPSGGTIDETMFRQIVEHADDLIAVLDLEGKRVYNSPSYQTLLEEPDTLEGTSSFVDVHPEDRETVRRVFQETVASGVGQRLEYRLIGRDGNIRYIESQGSVITNAAGAPDKVVIFSRDITARRHPGEVMRMIVEEIARLRRDEFFPGLVRALARALGAKYVLVSECTDRRRERVRALAYWAGGGLAPVFEYDVKNTTCEQVVQHGRTMYFAADVKKLFPEEAALGAMNAYAYLGVPLLDTSATPIGHLFVIHDQPLVNEELARSVLSVTAARAAAELEHRRSLERLGEAERRSRTLLEEMTDGVIVTDMEDVITYVNGRMSEISGYAVDEMVGKLASTLLVPDEARRDLYVRNDRRRRGLSERYDAALKRKDGSRFGARISAAPHRDASGDIVGSLALVAVLDQGEQVQTPPLGEGAGLLEKALDAVFVCDPDDHVLFWNSAAAQLYGWTADEARGKTSAELLHTEGIHRLGGAAHTALLEGYWAGELRQRRKDGGVILVDSRWTLIRDADGRPKSLLVICTDITGKKELEIYELRARRMGGIATLASAIAADLDSLLTPVMLAVPALAEKATDDPSRQAVALVATNAQRGMDMADQVLALAENAGGGRGFLDTVRLLDEVAHTLSASIPESITVEKVVPRSLWPVPGIMAQLQQVLYNVWSNAREAMPDGGVLRLTAENLLIDAQAVASIPHALPGKYVLMTVGDTGCGIQPEIITKVFEPFFTTKPPGRLTGLGLSTAAAIIRNHKGFINIFSEPAKGTIVKIYLPAGERSEGEEEAGLHLGHGERILVAQQQAALRDIIKKILEAHGYDVVTAADGAEAVALYRKQQGEIRAVVIDLDMPYMDGSTTIRVLQGTNSALRVIATGGQEGRDEVTVFSLLPKPFTTTALLNSLHNALTK